MKQEVNIYRALYRLFNTKNPDYIEKTLLRFVAAGANIDQIILEKPAIYWSVYGARICLNFVNNNYSLEGWYRNLDSLLRNRADVNQVDSNRDFALRLACGLDNNYRPILIDELLREHIDVNIPNKREKTALISRYLTGGKIEDLLIHGATINAVDSNNSSALYLVCKWQANSGIIEAFLQNSINSIIRDRQKYIAQYYIKSVNKIILPEFSR